MTITEDAPAGHVGTRRLRKEDPALLTGEAKFIDDLALPGAVWVGVVRSTEAHANIVGIDGSAALEIDGVNEVLTGEDLAPLWGEGALPCAWPVTPDMKNPPHLPVARGTAKYVGDAVAVVLADSRYAAADGAAAVIVDYEPLPAVVEIEDAVAEGAPLVHPDVGTNECYTWGLWGDNAAAVDAAFAEAAHVVSERYVQQRLIPAPMEPRGCAAVPSPAGRELTLYSSTQIPHILKVMTAVVLGIGENKLRVVAPVSGRRLRMQAQRLRRGDPVQRPGDAAGRARALDRGPHRGRHLHHPGQGSGAAHRAGRRCRRQGAGSAGEAAGRHGCLPAAGHAGRAAAGRVPCTTAATTSVSTSSSARRCSPTGPRPTPTGARGGPRPPTPSSGPWTRWRCPWGCRPRRSAPATSFPPTPSRTRRAPGSPSTAATTRPCSTRLSRWPGSPSAGPSRPSVGPRARRSGSASASPATWRCAAWPPAGCWRRSPTARAAGRRPRCGSRPPARCRW